MISRAFFSSFAPKRGEPRNGICHAPLREDEQIDLVGYRLCTLGKSCPELLLIKSERALNKTVNSLNVSAHFAGDPVDRILRRDKRCGQRCHNADPAAAPYGITAHLLIHTHDGNAQILCHILRGVCNLADGGAEIQYRIAVFLNRFHIHLHKPCRRFRGDIARLADVADYRAVMQRQHIDSVAQIIADLALDKLLKLGCSAGIYQTNLHKSHLMFILHPMFDVV